MHRSLLSLGSFPYLSNPAPYLTLQTFQAALIILTNRDDSKIRRNMDNEDEDLYQNRLDARKRRMIFQSVTTRAGDTGSGGGNTSRSAENDEDLREVYEYVVSHNYQDQDLGHTIIHLPGPELAALENFPSSQSRKLDRSISCQDFKALVKILLVTQLFDTVDPEKATENLDQLNHIVESIIKGFVKEKNDVDWSTYEKGVSQSVVSLLPNHYKTGTDIHSRTCMRDWIEYLVLLSWSKQTFCLNLSPQQRMRLPRSSNLHFWYLIQQLPGLLV